MWFGLFALCLTMIQYLTLCPPKITFISLPLPTSVKNTFFKTKTNFKWIKELGFEFFTKSDEHYYWNSKQLQIKILKLKLVQIKCPHITTNTTQHRSEREPTNHNKHKTKVPPWVWVWFRSERERERERGKAWGHGFGVDQRKQRGFKREIVELEVVWCKMKMALN